MNETTSASCLHSRTHKLALLFRIVYGMNYCSRMDARSRLVTNCNFIRQAVSASEREAETQENPIVRFVVPASRTLISKGKPEYIGEDGVAIISYAKMTNAGTDLISR